MASNKLPPSGNIIYDSGNDTSTGKKRAVLPGGGISVAERARLFGTQVTHASPSKTHNPTDRQTQRPPFNNQSTKSNVIRQDNNYHTPKTDTDQRPKQNTTYSSSQRVPNNYRSATEINERTKREQLSPINPRDYSKTVRPNSYYPPPPSRQQPAASYNNFNRVSPQKQAPIKPKYTQIIPSESYSSEDDTYSTLYNRQKPPPNNPKVSRNSTYRASNYFRPIQDPLDVLFKDAPQEYIQQQMPTTIETNVNGLQAFDLGSLISRIQQDYADNARPYVSSVQFVENNQSLANIGFLTPAVNRKDYTRRTGDIYNRYASSQHYDIIDTNGFSPYVKMNSRQPYIDNHYASMPRRRHHKRYHNQASSPIHIVESSTNVNTRVKPESLPATPVPKVPTPVASSSSSEEEEEETKPAKPESSTESESEEESTEVPSQTLPSQTARAPDTTSTPATQPNGIARPPLPNQTPLATTRVQPKPVASETSDSDESDSDSDSESDDDEDEDEKPKPKPKPVPPPVRSNLQRTTPATPSTISRGAPQRSNLDNNSISQLPEPSQSGNSVDFQDSGKPSSFGGKLKSLTNVFRRNKS